jgi:hypothetical protein
MSEHTVDVMIGANGNYIIEDGDVHQPDTEETYFMKCWCHDRKHRGVEGMIPSMFPGVDPHVVGITKYTLYWEVK